MDKRIAIYPGTFDPITHGHWDIISRALKVVDKLVIAVANNTSKGPLLTADERRSIILQDMELHKNLADRIEVITFGGLTVDLAKSYGAFVIIRGLRALSDFEFEFQLAGMNSKLDSNIETLFLIANEKHQFVSSSLVKEIARLGGDVSQFVSPHVRDVLQSRFSKKI